MLISKLDFTLLDKRSRIRSRKKMNVGNATEELIDLTEHEYVNLIWGYILYLRNIADLKFYNTFEKQIHSAIRNTKFSDDYFAHNLCDIFSSFTRGDYIRFKVNCF